MNLIKPKIIKLLALIDIVIGVLLIIMPLIFSLPLLGLGHNPVTLETIFIPLALPLLAITLGIGILLKRDWARAFGFFICTLAIIYSLATLFTIKSNNFNMSNLDKTINFFVDSVLPISGILYFAVHAFVLYKYTAVIIGKEAVPTQKNKLTGYHIPEYTCDNCKKAIPPGTEICSHCGELIYGLKCSNCSYIGKASDFVEHKCPQCGYDNSD